MNEKYLPIKIFEKRKEYDDRKTEAGGSPDRDYSWVLHGEPLKQHMQLLTQSLSTMKERCAERKSEGKVLPVVMKTTLHAEALAKTHRKKLVDVLESDGHENVIGVYGDRQILSLVENNAILDKITDVINKEDNASVISAITDMELYEPFIERTESGCGEYRVRLLNYNDYDRNQLVKILFEQHCRQHNIKLNTATRFTSDMYIYRVTIDSADEMNFLEDFEGLYAAEETKPLALTLDALEFDEASMVRVPDPEENYPLAGVLDTGIAGISYLKPWKEAKEHTNYPVEYQNNAHGTFVAGIMEYGDELNSYKVYSTKGIRLFNAVVYPDERKEAIYPEDLVDNIREAVKRNPQVKVWNLSLGIKEECENFDVLVLLGKGAKELGKTKDSKSFYMEALMVGKNSGCEIEERMEIIAELFQMFEKSDFYSVQSIENEYISLLELKKDYKPAIKILEYYQKNMPSEVLKKFEIF